jgi:spore maturation protein CgeB
MYPKRARFLQQVAPYLNGLRLVTGNIQVQDLRGLCVRETAALYADNLRKIKVFVNLPTLCQLAVTKVYEVLACGTFLITPAIADYRNFEDLQAHFYDSNRPDQLAESIRFCLQHEEDRIAATSISCDQVHQLHRLDLRCQVLLSALGGS